MNRYPMFNPQLLLSFVAVCDSNSFTRAAERVFLSQSTVSQQVRRLEEMLGKPLFERSSHQVLLTEEGVKLLSYARRIIALNEEAHDALTGIWRDGVLRIGMPEDFAVPTTELLADFSREHPHLRLDVASGLSADLHSAYAREELDLILVKQRRRQPPRRAAGTAAMAGQPGLPGHRAIAGAAGGISAQRPVPRRAVPGAGQPRQTLAHRLQQRQPGGADRRFRRRAGRHPAAGRLPSAHAPGAGRGRRITADRQLRTGALLPRRRPAATLALAQRLAVFCGLK